MYYFAYGSNMNRARLRSRLGRDVIGKPGRLADYKLKFNKMARRNPAEEGYANIVECPGCEVWGVLYDVSEDDLERLDCCEGVKDGHYERKTVPIEVEDGNTLEAHTYIACPGKVREGLKPTREYLDHLLAARSILPPSYVKTLENVETLD